MAPETNKERTTEYLSTECSQKPQRHDLGDLSRLPWVPILDDEMQVTLMRLMIECPEVYGIDTINNVVADHLYLQGSGNQ